MDDTISVKWHNAGAGIAVMEQGIFDPSMFKINGDMLEIKGAGNPFAPIAYRVPLPTLCNQNEWTTISTRYVDGQTELFSGGVQFALLDEHKGV